MPTVRPFRLGDLDACVDIVQGLPEFFTDDVPDKVRAEVAVNRCWVIDESGTVGFAIAQLRSHRAAEITWAAVERSHRNGGLGTALIEQVLDELAREGVEFVEVKTLDESEPYEPYIATRHFWEQRGFVQIDMIDPLPGWQPGNPSAIYVTSLGSRQSLRLATINIGVCSTDELDTATAFWEAVLDTKLEDQFVINIRVREASEPHYGHRAAFGIAVPDLDAFVDRALKAGADRHYPPTQSDNQPRHSLIHDPVGNRVVVWQA